MSLHASISVTVPGITSYFPSVCNIIHHSPLGPVTHTAISEVISLRLVYKVSIFMPVIRAGLSHTITESRVCVYKPELLRECLWAGWKRGDDCTFCIQQYYSSWVHILSLHVLKNVYIKMYCTCMSTQYLTYSLAVCTENKALHTGIHNECTLFRIASLYTFFHNSEDLFVQTER